MNQLFNASCFEKLPTLPEGSIDLVFADPPYNLQLKHALWRPNMTQVDAVDDAWDQFENFAAYDDFTRRWLIETRRVMTDSATIWVSGTYHNIFRVGTIMQDLGFWVLNTITFWKTNAMPNFRGTRLKNDVEFVIWAKKSETSRYTFNHHLMKRYNEGKQLGSVWQIPATGGEERLKGNDGKKLHSTQKPEALLERIILASSHPDDVVLDPFSGTGTTAAVAKRMRRNYIGIELDTTYYQASLARLETVTPLPDDDSLIVYPQKQKRVAFKSLLEAGHLRPSDYLYLDSPDCTAVILPDGQLQVGEIVGSIHRVGAILKQAPSCNGWKHWFYRDITGKLQLLDCLRDGIN
ncbi:MAG TPA: DNA methyltransferase [Phototrophicaceae bacterium]|jgi:DNA modification methylase|nr:DNA methyltransferase [Phototrophicaceae bacterium]